MCGIVGWVGHGRELRERGERALDLLSHRGPDAGALWIAPDADLALGSRRLAILDLRHAADQPMHRRDRSLVHNGEIYNFAELRAELVGLGRTFDTTSDTEVMLQAFDMWGDAAVERFNGMFAFAVWDARARRLMLARDRFGEKPLYYARGNDCFHFASEIKALLQFQCVARTPDARSLYEFLATGQVPDGSNRTFFEGISQLAPASILHVDERGDVLVERKFWSLAADARASTLTFRAAADRLADLLEDSVRIRLRSDVATGTSLSGGVDSSLVAMTASRLLDPTAPRQRTFSARHTAGSVDEGRFIAPVVAATRADPSEVWVDPEELPTAIERLVWHQDEPFPHTSLFAQWKVYELARRQGVTVLLDGQGADEVFGGYHSLAFGALWGGMLRRADLRGLAHEVGAYRRVHAAGPALVARFLAAGSTPAWLQARARRMRWRSRGLVAKMTAPPARHRSSAECGAVSGALHRALCDATLRTSLPGLLRFADRSSMAHSIEVRLPFLDHRVVEFAFGVPDEYLVAEGWSKRILRELLRRDLPAIAERRDKIGFATPEREWFAGPLAGWMEGVLRTAADRELFARREIDQMWADVRAGHTPTQVAWRVVSVELWLRRYVDPSVVTPPESAFALP